MRNFCIIFTYKRAGASDRSIQIVNMAQFASAFGDVKSLGDRVKANACDVANKWNRKFAGEEKVRYARLREHNYKTNTIVTPQQQQLKDRERRFLIFLDIVVTNWNFNRKANGLFESVVMQPADASIQLRHKW